MSHVVALLHRGGEYLDSRILKELAMIPKRGKVGSFTEFFGTTMFYCGWLALLSFFDQLFCKPVLQGRSSTDMKVSKRWT